MLKTVLLILFSLFFKIANCQAPVFQWVGQFSTDPANNYTDYSGGTSVALDQQGNVYSAGRFSHRMDFDPGPGFYYMDAQGPSNTAIYISKLSPSGDLLWAVQLPLQIEGYIYMTTDNSGNVYLTSELRKPADMDPGPGVHIMTPIGAKDAFVIKLDANGNFLWAQQFGSTVPDTVPTGTSVSVDTNGDVIVTGEFNNTVDFDPGPAVFNLAALQGGNFQAFVVKLTSNGDFKWAKKLGNYTSVFEDIYLQEVKCDLSGNIYATGWFKGNCDFDPGPGVFNLTSAGTADGFVVKLDANGNFNWARRIGNAPGSYVVQAQSLDMDGQGNILVTGTFIGAVDFDPGAGSSVISSQGQDGFIFKLDNQGNYKWAKCLGGSDLDLAFEVVVDSNDNLYISGDFTGDVDFDPGPGVFLMTGLYDAAVIIKLDPQGDFMYASAFKRISDGYLVGRSLAVDPAFNIYMTGHFAGEVDADPGPVVYPIYGSANAFIPYVIKLAKCTNITTSQITASVCNNYVLNSQTYTASGIYTQTIPNQAGCDSVITLNLTINRKFSSQSKAICEGESFYAGGANQTSSGIYKDTLQTTPGCDSIITTTLTVNPRPVPNLGPDMDLCSGSSVTLNPGSFNNYRWQDLSSAPTFTTSATGLYWVVVTNSYNCTVADSIIIRSVKPLPSNFLKPTDSICLNRRLTIVPLTNYSSYLWSTGATSPALDITGPGQYYLSVTDADGCTGNDTIVVMGKNCTNAVFFPNAFVPAGTNKLFKAGVLGNLSSFHLEVYNRYGALIFFTDNPLTGWDGTYKGKPQPFSVYTWRCVYQPPGLPRTEEWGTVTLIR